RVVGDDRMRLALKTNHHSLVTNHQRLFGGHKAVVRPVPIPNTAVKRSLADGSGLIDSARVGCRQPFTKSRSSPPEFRLFVVSVGVPTIPLTLPLSCSHYPADVEA